MLGDLVGKDEGKTVGIAVGLRVGTTVGLGEGEKLKSDTPAPVTATTPVQEVVPTQPSRMINVWEADLSGTVYCTCAQMLFPLKHALGGMSPVPVSSYTSSMPVDVKRRRVVWPVHEAPGYRAPHILTTNVCPALAVTPQEATFCVSDAVLVAENIPHRSSLVGRVVGIDEGAGEGAVGAVVGIAEGAVNAVVGPAVGKDEGDGVGQAVVGRSVGIQLGSAEGRGVAAMVGIAEGG